MDNSLAEMQERVSPIVEPLHEAFLYARERTSEMNLGELGDPGLQWLRTHHLRAWARVALERRTLDGWVVAGNPKASGALWLATHDADYRIRVLRDGRDGFAPPAGHNLARRRYYSNQGGALFPLSLDEKEMQHNLLTLWNEPDRENDFMLRLVRPLEPGKYRRRMKVDIDMPLPRTRTDFENLRFVIDDEYEDLHVNISNEEIEDDENGGAAL